MIFKKENQFEGVVKLIKQAHNTSLRLVNTVLIDLYWNIGEYVSTKANSDGWGKSTVTQLANYIALNAPNTKGFSDKNIWRMKQFYEAYCEFPKLSPLVREITSDFRDNCVFEFLGKPSIDNEVVEYALSRSLSPTMVAEYKLQLPSKKVSQEKLREILL